MTTPPTGTSVPPETQREIIRLYKSGLTLNQVSERVYWAKQTVVNVLILNGVERRPQGVAHGYQRPKALEGDRLERAVEMYRSGLSMAVVARHFGIARSTVIHAFRRAGVEARTRNETITLARRREIAHEDALTPIQRQLLDHLERHGPSVTTDIAAAVRMSVRSTRHALGKLERHGLVRSRHLHARLLRWRRTDLSTRDVLDHALALPPGVKPADEYLPIEPFRRFLEDLIAHEERKAKLSVVAIEDGGDGTGGIPTVGAVATRLNVLDRQIWRWLHEQRTIALSTADRVLQAHDGATTIYDLWPHLGVVEDEEMAA